MLNEIFGLEPSSVFSKVFLKTNPKLKRFDDGADIVLGIFGIRYEKGNLRMQPRMDQFQTAQSFER